jgi:BCD family chlorophyll transporter-like MFS transporter
MRSAPRDQIGLSLGAWGAVQTTAAGVAIAAGGVIRDAMLLVPGKATAGAGPYIPVFALEAGLLALALVAAWPLVRRGVDTAGAGPSSEHRMPAGAPEGLHGSKA